MNAPLEPRPVGERFEVPFFEPASVGPSSSFAADDRGATAIEYALIACFVALAIFVGATATGTGLNSIFAIVGSKTQSASDAAAGNTGN